MVLAKRETPHITSDDFVDRHHVCVHVARHHRRDLKSGVSIAPEIVLRLIADTAMLVVANLAHETRRLGRRLIGSGSQLPRSRDDILEAKCKCARYRDQRSNEHAYDPLPAHAVAPRSRIP